MKGFGIYTWPGGRKYIGFYLNDQKEGYGIYYWNDGRIFKGWWSNNRQFGLGIYLCEEEEEKYGLWEKGKRIMWFSQDQIDMINNKKYDYTALFSDPSSKEQIMKDTTFEPPANYHTSIKKLKEIYPEYDQFI